jgi:hypothetical protein
VINMNVTRLCCNYVSIMQEFTVLITHINSQTHTHLSTYLLTYSMEQSPSWQANCFVVSQEISRVLLNPKLHYHVHNCSLPVTILSQPNPVHTPTSHLLKIDPNIIVPSTPGSPQWLFLSGFPTTNPINASLLSHLRYMPRPSHSSPL